jgi:hypothetical protein
MDPTLASLFGTLEPAEITEEEIQKTAQLHLLEKLAEKSGIDLNQLSDQEIQEAYEYVGQIQQAQGHEKVAAQQDDSDEMTKEAAEMVSNAAMMGRIMAHAYVDELKGIQKAAMMKQALEEGEGEDESDEDDDSEDEGEEKKKEAAIHQAIEAEAIEMLKSAGAVNPDGTLMNPDQYKAALGYGNDSGEAVKVAALQTLEAMGYPVSWE